MSRDYNQMKSVSKYLKKRYGNIRGYCMQDIDILVEDISNDHSLVQLKKMKRRIDGQLSVSKDTSYLNNNPINLLIALLPILATSLIAFITIGANSINFYVENYMKIYNQKITKEELKSIFIDILNPTVFFNIYTMFLLIFFVIIYLMILLINKGLRRPIYNTYNYSVILEEAIIQKKRENTEQGEIL
ncbi:hypothetical protein [Niallia sp. FSL R7-0271]|uniref:hypothetical protein n=1 Tax=Niallia sp. FSL R7-0271 TaxID=2921678 RepID=UPI0030FD0998